MKYTFSKDGKVEMVTIEVDATNTVTRPATEQDHLDAKEHEAARKAYEAAQEKEAKTKGITLPPIDDLSAADKKVVQDEEDAEAAYQKKKR